MPKKKQEPQPKQEAQETQEPLISQEELERLMNLSLNEISQLPEEIQNVVFTAAASQLQPSEKGENPFILSGISLNRAQERFNSIAEKAKRYQEIFVEAAKAIESFFVKNRDIFIALKTLDPYMDAEIAENPEKYETAPFEELVIAAAKRARAEGLEIPLFPVEQSKEPEEINLSFPTDKNAKEPIKPSAAEIVETLKQVQYKDSDKVKIATDKLALAFFSALAPKPKGTQLKPNLKELQEAGAKDSYIPLNYERPNAKKELRLLYNYSLDKAKELGLGDSFTAYDFFVTTALDNLKANGNDTVSLTKIWHEMGNEGSPNGEQLTDLHTSLLKGIATPIIVDDSEIQKAWGGDRFKEFASSVMPIQMVNERFMSNGRIAGGTVKILAYSPFYIVASGTEHISGWAKDLLKLYKGKRTQRYYSVMRYLIWQIGWMRNKKSKRSNKLTYSTLYQHTNAITSRDKQLTLAMMYRLIDEVFIPAGTVTKRVEDTKGEPGVFITLNPSGKPHKQLTGNSDLLDFQ